MDFVIKSKRGQVTLFIVLAILLVSSVVLLFTLKPELNLFRQKTSSPAEYLSDCVEDSIKSYEKSFFDSKNMLQEGSLNYVYNKQTIPFLCYSTEFYNPCIPQNPLLIESVRKKMENSASRELSRCVLSIKEDYERQGYSFEYSNFSMSVILNELDISYSARINMIIPRGDETILISTREGKVPSVLPKLLRTAETIVNYETSFCEFNHMTWQAVNRGIVIERFRSGDQTKVYTLRDRNSDKEIKFAIRTCVMPAGI